MDEGRITCHISQSRCLFYDIQGQYIFPALLLCFTVVHTGSHVGSAVSGGVTGKVADALAVGRLVAAQLGIHQPSLGNVKLLPTSCSAELQLSSFL